MKVPYARLLTLLTAVSTLESQGAPNFYRATSVKGAIAYQAQNDKKQFFYIPTSTESLLGDRLRTFRVSYYGIGPAFYVRNGTTGSVESSVGAILSAAAVIGIDDATRRRLSAQITADFGVANPRLVPMPLANAKIQSLLLEDAINVAKLGQITSSNPSFEQEFAFSAGAKDNLFAQILATSDANSYGGVVANPHFTVELVGEAEFVGDPWKVEIDCDLAQVWKQVRTAASVSASIGWFRLGEANYNRINQDLARSGACRYTELPGSLIDPAKNLLPLLEMTRKIFEQLNAEARGGQGFFKFEPNPEAPAVSASGAKSVWPWRVSVNAGYSSAHFTQKLTWKTTVELGTRFMYPIGATTSMAVLCNNQTKQFFQDLGNTAENCITQGKIDQLMRRLATEKAIVNQKLNDLEHRLIAGTVSTDVYNVLYRRWTTTSQTEGAQVVGAELQAWLLRDPVVLTGFSLRQPTSVDQDVAWALEELKKGKP